MVTAIFPQFLTNTTLEVMPPRTRHPGAAVLTPAALAFRAHSGWAAFVALAGTPHHPSVVRRGRIELCNRGVHREGQPFHAAAEMPLDEARGFLDECALTARGMAELSLRPLLAEIRQKGYRVRAACVIAAAGRPLPDLSRILAAHPLIHTAEGEFFRDAVHQACRACHLSVTRTPERSLAVSPEIAGLGKLLGPPWRQDEKLCAAAASLLLSPPG